MGELLDTLHGRVSFHRNLDMLETESNRNLVIQERQKVLLSEME